jgi:hypothetical protein
MECTLLLGCLHDSRRMEVSTQSVGARHVVPLRSLYCNNSSLITQNNSSQFLKFVPLRDHPQKD